MDIVGFKLRLQKAAQSLEVDLVDNQIDTLLNYLQQMQRWNKTYNLTALRDSESMLIQHIFDSLSVVKPIQKIAEQKKQASLKILDVGSGGGLPGVVLATSSSTWNIHCLDAVEKKMAFVRQMSAVLRLPNLEAHHQRIEHGDSFNADIVISRAFASLVDFVELTERHVNAEGHLLAMKAKHPSDEIQELEVKTNWCVDHIVQLHVPELDAERCLIYLKRK